MTILYTYKDTKELKKYIKKEKKENRKVISMAMYLYNESNNEFNYNFGGLSIDISNFILSINNNYVNPNFLENKIIEIFNLYYEKTRKSIKNN